MLSCGAGNGRFGVGRKTQAANEVIQQEREMTRAVMVVELRWL